MLAQEEIHARAAAPSLSSFIIGFVERSHREAAAPCLQLPFATPVIHVALGESARPPVMFSAGSRRARIVPATSGISTFVIALGFGGAAALCPDEMRETEGTFTALDYPFWLALHTRLSDAAGFERRVRITEDVLASHLVLKNPATRQSIGAADAIIQNRWKGPVAALAAAFGTEERTLRNHFRREIGWTPKRLLRVARFNRVLRALHPKPWAGRADGDVWLEFADQAHFHHEFTALANITPTAFVEAKRSTRDGLLYNVILETGYRQRFHKPD